MFYTDMIIQKLDYFSHNEVLWHFPGFSKSTVIANHMLSITQPRVSVVHSAKGKKAKRRLRLNRRSEENIIL